MMYSEFVENTGCKDTAFNRDVFRRLEIVYMNDGTCTKEWVYESGKKLVDNSLTEEQKHHNEQVKIKIECNKNYIKSKEEEIERAKVNIKCEKETTNEKWYLDSLKREIKWCREDIQRVKIENRILKESIIK